jgi:cytochrome c
MCRFASGFLQGSRVVLILASCVLTACGANGAAGTGGEIQVTEFNAPVVQPAGHYGYGSDASDAEIAGWDIDIRPDGLGLPPGGGTVEDGEFLYEDQCAICHGSFGEGVGRYPVIAGGQGTLTESRPEKTVGSFWPYASTLWDYVHRAMPFAEPESLSDDEVYAISAYVLYLNDLVGYDFELNRDNLASIEMPNKDGFFLDDRPDVKNELCMSNCKDSAGIEITSEPAPSEDPDPQVQSAAVAGTSPGESIYLQACALCHASGVGDAPILGEQDVWAERIAAGRDLMIASSIDGKGVMPPKGGQLQLSDEDIIAAVDYMIEQSAN